MKTHLLTAAISGLFTFSVLLTSAQESSIDRSIVVLQLDALDAEKNLDLHSHFERSERYRLINSCEALAIVVFDSDQPLAIARNGVLSEVRTAGIDEVELLDDMTATEVMIECRQQMREMLDPGSGE